MAPWYVRAPPTITLKAAIKDLRTAKGCPDGVDCYSLLPDGSFIDEDQSIADLGLKPGDVVKVNWDAEEAAAEVAAAKKKNKNTSASMAGKQSMTSDLCFG